MEIHGRVVGRKIEGQKIVPLIFHLRTRRHGKAEGAENLHDVLDDAAGRMNPANPAPAPGHGEVQSTVGRRRATERFTAGLEGFLEALLQAH